jgi:parvulin-like peptidyl-prolyl isomerase
LLEYVRAKARRGEPLHDDALKMLSVKSLHPGSWPARIRRSGLPLLGLLMLTAAGDPPSDIVAQRGDVQMTASELRDLLAATDPAQRAQLEGNQAALADFVRQRVLTQALLSEARAKGWDQRPDVAQRANDARDSVILQSYIMSLVPDPGAPSDAEIAAAYEANKARMMLPRQYHLAQIVLVVPPNAPQDVEDAARRKIQDLRARALKPKADFGDLARQNSQEASSAVKGGDIGWLREDQLLPVVRAAVVKMADGSTSDAVRVPDGWHVLRLLGTRPPGPVSLAEATPQLIQAMRQARSQQEVRAYVAQMLRNQPVQIDTGELAKQVAPP